MSDPILQRLAEHCRVPCFLPIDRQADEKSPSYKDWPTNVKSLDRLDKYLSAGFNVGLLLGPTTNVIDIEGDADDAEQSLLSLFGGEPTPTLSFASRKGLHRLYQFDARLGHLPATLRDLPDLPGVEVRLGTSAAQSVIPSSIVGGHQREWTTDLPIATLPDAVVERLASLRQPKPRQDDWDDLAAPPRADFARVLQAVASLNPTRADRYDDWLRVGAALRSAGDEYFGVFDAWSRQSPKYGGTQELWSNLRQSKPHGITIGTLYYLASQDGHPVTAADDDDPVAYFGILTSKQLSETSFDERWLIDDMLVMGQPGVVGGPEKSLKTSILLDAAVSLASGEPFLSKFPVINRCCALVMTAESGMGAIKETARQVCITKGVCLSDLDIVWSPRLPMLSDHRDLDRLQAAIRRFGVSIVVIDPAYLCLGADDAGNVFEMGALLRRVSEACSAVGASPIMAHHGTKHISRASSSPITLADLSQAGFREWAGTWWLLNRRTEYAAGEPHRLWLRAGSRSGDTYDYALDIFEGTRKKGKVWQINRVIERHALKAAEQKEQLQHDIAVIEAYLAEHPEGKALTRIYTDLEMSEAHALAARGTKAILAGGGLRGVGAELELGCLA